jgi:imidazoleglycerol-phosphate dehydratase
VGERYVRNVQVRGSNPLISTIFFAQNCWPPKRSEKRTFYRDREIDMGRESEIERKTKETEVHLRLNLDGSGRSQISTGIPFMDHMLTLMTAHGFMDMELDARGDTGIDDHHTVEDLGICLGLALKGALGGMKGIRRFGEATVPMDEALARVVIDTSNRPVLSYRVSLRKRTTGNFDVGLIKEFFRALVINAGITMHVDLIAGEDPHHISEAIFKAFARALDQAGTLEGRLHGDVPSTKGLL